jgi:hypothetical protein
MATRNLTQPLPMADTQDRDETGVELVERLNKLSSTLDPLYNGPDRVFEGDHFRRAVSLQNVDEHSRVYLGDVLACGALLRQFCTQAKKVDVTKIMDIFDRQNAELAELRKQRDAVNDTLKNMSETFTSQNARLLEQNEKLLAQVGDIHCLTAAVEEGEEGKPMLHWISHDVMDFGEKTLKAMSNLNTSLNKVVTDLEINSTDTATVMATTSAMARSITRFSEILGEMRDTICGIGINIAANTGVLHTIKAAITTTTTPFFSGITDVVSNALVSFTSPRVPPGDLAPSAASSTPGDSSRKRDREPEEESLGSRPHTSL